MRASKYLEVYMGDIKVGTLAETKEHLIAFEYTDEWVQKGFSISPFSLPLTKGVFLPKKYDPFDGLFGVFADSLPDGWGRLLVDRLLQKNGINPATVSPLTRLAIVGVSDFGEDVKKYLIRFIRLVILTMMLKIELKKQEG